MKNISYWLDVPYIPRKPLEENIRVDVVVIGGGITGVSTAYHCVKLGFKTTLIEKDEIASGSAGKNGGMIVEGLPIDFLEAVEQFGAVEAKEIWDSTTEAQALTKSIIKENNIDCDLTENGSLYIGLSEEDKKWLKLESDARSKNSIFSEFNEVCQEFKSPSFTSSIYNKMDAGLDPVKFVRGLADKSEKLGLQIFEKTTAVSFSNSVVTTEKGTIKASKVVVALESSDSVGTESSSVQDSIGLMTEALPERVLSKLSWNKGEMMWTTGQDYICIRRFKDRLFLNGSDTNNILELFFSYFPKLSRDDISISHEWSGKIMYPNNCRPSILNKNGAYHVFGQGGNGLTNGVITGKVLAESFTGKEIPRIYRMLE